MLYVFNPNRTTGYILYDFRHCTRQSPSQTLFFLFLSPYGESPRRGIEVGKGHRPCRLACQEILIIYTVGITNHNDKRNALLIYDSYPSGLGYNINARLKKQSGISLSLTG